MSQSGVWLFRSQKLFFLSLILAAHTAVAAPGFNKLMQKAKAQAALGEWKDAVATLSDVKDEGLDKRQLSEKYFSLGKNLMDADKRKEAIEALQLALKYDASLGAYINYLLGHAYKLENDYQQATLYFNKAIEGNPPRNIIYQARFETSEMALKAGQPQKAESNLQYLERRWRGTAEHPEIVWRLIGVELKRDRRWQACRWARKMYSSYAGHQNVDNWGVDLHENDYEGKPLGCLASPNDLKIRVKRLQLYGLADKARRELDTLMSRKSEGSKYEVDLMYADFLEFQGFPDEALKILIAHYEKQKNDFNYLTLLGRIASRASEFPTAVGAYYRAYQKTPGSTSGRKALFSAAFLSYQFQDYDGASRKFQELNRRFPGSGLARDARWHLAWIRYLKRDYKGAEGDFRTLMAESYRQRRRMVQPFNDDRSRYWLAMTLVRQDRPNEALVLFQKIAGADTQYNFYGVLAKERLSQLGVTAGTRALAGVAIGGPEAVDALVKMPNPNAPTETNADVPDTEESEETMTTTEEKVTPEEAPVEVAAELERGGKEESVVPTPFKDPKLQERFDRAHEFIRLGFNDWAKWELYEIERRTTNKTYLRMLMESYDKIGSYNRSVYISEIFFSTDRSRGLQNARDVWQWNFPRAFEKPVTEYSDAFGISRDLAWSIMRAESRYFPEAISPVGARGLMQIMPYTAEQISKLLSDGNYKRESLIDPDMNIRYGTRYLSRLQRQFEGQIPLVAAAYNAGPHRVYSWLNTFGNLDMDEFIEHIPFVETRNYVKKVLRHYIVYRGLYSPESEEKLTWITQPVPVRVTSRPSPRENWGTID